VPHRARRFALCRAQPQGDRSSPSRDAVPAPVVRTGRHPEAGDSLAIDVRWLRRDWATGKRETRERTVQTLIHGCILIVRLIAICWSPGERANPWETTRALPWAGMLRPLRGEESRNSRRSPLLFLSGQGCKIRMLALTVHQLRSRRSRMGHPLPFCEPREETPGSTPASPPLQGSSEPGSRKAICWLNHPRYEITDRAPPITCQPEDRSCGARYGLLGNVRPRAQFVRQMRYYTGERLPRFGSTATGPKALGETT